MSKKPIYKKTGNQFSDIDCNLVFSKSGNSRAMNLSCEKLFRRITEKSPAGIAITSPSGELIFCNQSMADIVGYSRDELLNMDLKQLAHPDDLKKDCQCIAELLDGKTDKCRIEKKYIHKNGHVVCVDLSASVIRDEKGEVQFGIAFAKDVTEQKHLRKKLQETRKSEAISTLIGGIAHDFNNLLGIIIGNAELGLEDLASWEPVYSNLEEIVNAGLRARKIVRQLLTFSTNLAHESLPVDLISALKDSVKCLHSIVPQNIEILLNCKTEQATILSHPSLINRIVVNIGENARRAMENNGGVLEISAGIVEIDEKSIKKYHDLNCGKYARVTITDSGPGIDPTIIDRIFDPYFTTGDIGEGCGMGLAVVHGIVKNHKGAVTVENKPGKGASFEILFPLLNDITADKPETGPKDRLPGGKENILYVDDEKSLLEMVKQRLERLGYNVTTVISPLDALVLLKSNPNRFDLVITDMTMPQLNGVEVFKQIKEIRNDIPVVLSTGHSELIDRKKASKIGAEGFLKKPFDKNQLAGTVRRVLDHKLKH